MKSACFEGRYWCEISIRALWRGRPPSGGHSLISALA